jgi:hypothetical protein
MNDKQISISLNQWWHLQECATMLGQIACVARRYCRHEKTTTLQAVIAMDKRVKKLNAKIKKLKSTSK